VGKTRVTAALLVGLVALYLVTGGWYILMNLLVR
jgi:hypothetical protein